jgi:outer membrane protein assembly factor BamB
MRTIGRLGIVWTVVAAAASATAPAQGAETARWPQFQGDARHLGLNPREHVLDISNVADLELSWVGQVGGDLDWSSPVVAGGSVYVTGGDSGLNVFPAAGCGQSTCPPTWRGQTGPQAIAAPAVFGSRVFVASQASFVSNDGRLNVFAADGCGQEVCQPLWKGIGGDESFLVSSPAVAGGIVYVGGFDGRVYAFDVRGCGAVTCQPLWVGEASGPIDSSPAVAGGLVYVGSANGDVSVFSAAGCGVATCAPLWLGRTGGGIDIASPTVAGGFVLVSGGNFLFAFDASGAD